MIDLTKLRAQRAALEVTREAIAERIGDGRPTVQQWSEYLRLSRQIEELDNALSQPTDPIIV